MAARDFSLSPKSPTLQSPYGLLILRSSHSRMMEAMILQVVLTVVLASILVCPLVAVAVARRL